MSAHEQKAPRALLARMHTEIAELARTRGIDVVVEVSMKGAEVIYGSNVAFPPRGPDLTDELIRVHDQRFP